MSTDARKYWAQKDAERQAAGGGFRQPGANLVTPSSPAPPDATRGEGTLTKYRPVGGWQTPAAPGANLAVNAAEMGEPTSFRGGAGAPPAAEVIRGSRMTYTNPAAAAPGGGYNPTPGTGTAEFATPTEAGQAFNRGQRGAFLAENPTNPNVTYPVGSSPEEQATAKFGAWRATGQTGEEIKGQAHVAGMSTYNKTDPVKQDYEAEQVRAFKAENAAKERGRIVGAAEKYYKGAVGGSIPTAKEPAYGKYMDAMNHAIAHPDQPDAFEKRYHENLQLETYEKLFTPDNLAAHGLTLPPGITQDQPKMRQLMLEWGPKLLGASPSKAGQLTATQEAINNPIGTALTGVGRATAGFGKAFVNQEVPPGEFVQ